MASVIVQSGHCHRKKGSTGTSGEQEFNAQAAAATVAELHQRGHDARSILADPPVAQYTADFFVAIHGDGSKSSKVRGASVGWRTTSGKAFAQLWKAAYVGHGWSSGFHADNYTEDLHLYYGTGNALAMNPKCRAIIVEGGFLTNADDRAEMHSPDGHRRVALAIADAVDRSLGNTPPEDDMPLTDQDIFKLLTTKFGGSDTTVAQAIERTYKTVGALSARVAEIEKALGAKHPDGPTGTLGEPT